MNFQPRDLSLGTLEVVEIYDYFDEPLFFACMNEREQRFVVLLAASNTDSKTWLYAPVSPGRLSALRDGKLPTYDVFRGVEAGAIFRATWRRTDRTWDATWVEAASVPDEMLPDPGVPLELEPEEDTDKIPDVDRLSHQLRRDVVAIRIKLPNRNDHIADANTDADADLIAHAPGDLAALVARVAALEAESAAQRATLADPRVAATLAEIQADEDAAVDHITDSPHRAALVARLTEIADGQPHPWADDTDFELYDMGLDCGGPDVIKATPSAARVLARLTAATEPTP